MISGQVRVGPGDGGVAREYVQGLQVLFHTIEPHFKWYGDGGFAVEAPAGMAAKDFFETVLGLGGQLMTAGVGEGLFQLLVRLLRFFH